MKLAKRMNVFPEYIFSTLNKKVKEIEQESGREILNLAIGNPDFPPSDKCLKELKKLIDDPHAHLYPGYEPTIEFQQALKDWYLKRFHVQLENSELYPLLGSKDGISHLSLVLLDENDEVLIPDPGYPAYVGTCLMAGAKPIYYDSIQEIKNKISNKTKLIWLNFPSNPTGQVVNKDSLKKLVQLATKHKIWLAYDNAYSEITFDNYKAPSILEIPGAKNVAIEFGSLSKTFSLAGYRIGWVVGNLELIAALAKIKSQFDSGLTLPLQKLAAFCLNDHDRKWHQSMISSYQQRAKILSKHLKKLGLTFNLPKASLYIWAKIPNTYKNSGNFCLQLLKKKQILIMPGTAFGKNGNKYVRISISSNIERINEYFK